ncbi:hypothetical protein [Bacillus sp. ISL-18]|uniref:hypothetical protein n=1 Tax=Bacillus sp. ISL-18 TaxID=2819118 RepID=UPI0027E1F740|nr:hypothetical protein [Bacillus sp. ISL-18]
MAASDAAAVSVAAAVSAAAAAAALVVSALALVALALVLVLFNLAYGELQKKRLFYKESAPAPTCVAGALLYYVIILDKKSYIN